MKTDLQLKADVNAELAWDPAVDATQVGVTVKDGVVTLSGGVDSYIQKHAIERAVRRVSGVRGVAIRIEVKLAPAQQRPDADIAHAALHALHWHVQVPEDQIRVEVEDGWVTLTGEVDWAHQYACAEQCVHPLIGVRGVTNRIQIRPRVSSTEVARQIAAALARQAEREARHITVEVSGSVVTLRGKVNSLPEHEAAIGTAYAARGVTRVIDKLEVVA